RLRWAVAAGAFSLLLLLFVGSLIAPFEWSAAHGHTNRPLYEAFGVEGLLPCEAGQAENCYSGPMNPRTSKWYPTEFWFWWKGTRLIPDTITEFPFFSFLLGDLHPHVMSIPLTLLAVGFAAATWRGRGILDWRMLRRQPAAAALLAVVFGALAFQNAWDVVTFSTLLGVAVLARNLRSAQVARALVSSAAYLGPVAVGAVVLYAPWWLTFGSQAGGLFAYTREGTRPAHALLQFGPVLLSALLVAGIAARRFERQRLFNVAIATAWVPVIPFIAWILRAWSQGELSTGVDARTGAGWVMLGLYGLALWGLATAAVVLGMRRHAGAIVAAAGALGALLLFGAELFYIKDVFSGSLPRLNTVFKLSYQAWILLSLAGGVGLAYAGARLPRWQAMSALPVLVLVVAGFTYPLLASFNRTNGFTNQTTLDGLASVARSDPNEYALLRWIGANTRPDDVLFETTGRRWARSQESGLTIVSQNIDYTNAGRISSRTGRPTPIGWYFHQVQWRGDTPNVREELGRRQRVVDSAYTATNGAEVIDAMREFGARYLVVGREEMANYPGLMPDYAQFMTIAFEAGSYRIYALPELRSIKT
ncbi:MAG TPA: DUF2298 domain-containing protein, partial [Tepidiformaceae bacterium]|nr:DUF2298 domain-containing protein [Tepidiformaceae bacterium]